MGAEYPNLETGMKLFVEPKKNARYFHVEYALVSYPIAPGHAIAFKVAADMLIEQHLSTTSNNDSLVFPVLTLYRHSIELALKDLVRLGLGLGVYNGASLKKILGEDYTGGELGKNSLLADHQLAPLWTQAVKLIREYSESDEQESVAESLINQLHQADRDGQKVRYDRDARTLRLDRKRFQHIPQAIDIGNLRHTMNCLFTYLETCHSYIVDLQDQGP